MMSKFNQQYFKSLNYTDYLSRLDRYRKLATELDELFSKFHLANKDSKILDYGCAVGFLMEGLGELGYNNIIGYDISKWAAKQAKKKRLNILDKIDKKVFDIIISFDVFEHMHNSEIKKTLSLFQSKILIVRIPCSIDGNQFVLDISKQDPTHINCKTKKSWTKFFSQFGYDTILPLNLLTIYDTPGVMCALCLKSGTQFFK